MASKLAAESLEASRTAVRKGKGRDAKDFAVTAGIAIDKSALLCGGPTVRAETVEYRTKLDQDIERLEAEVEAAMVAERVPGDDDIERETADDLRSPLFRRREEEAR